MNLHTDPSTSSMTVRPWTIWFMGWRCLTWRPLPRSRYSSPWLEVANGGEIAVFPNAGDDSI